MGTTSPALTKQAVTELHHAHYADLYRFFQRRGAQDLADDLTSEVFIIAWKKLPHSLENPRPWLFGVAKKVLSNARRKHARMQSLDVPIAGPNDHPSQTTPPVPGLSSHSAEIAIRVDLQRAWNKLGYRDQEILALTGWEGLSSEEAAAVLNISRSGAAMRLLRARKHLRSLLENVDGTPLTGTRVEPLEAS